jgi:hypothetical protein
VPSAITSERRRAVALVAGAAYALGAATTTAFTGPANVVTAVPIVGLAVLAVIRWPAHPQPLALPAEERARHPYRPWAVLVLAVVGWELVEYLVRGSRAAHPTLSSMADAVDRHYPGRAVLFFAWLCLGALIVRLGTPSKVASAEATAP